MPLYTLNRILLLALLTCLCASVAKADAPPSNEMIQSWWESNSTEKMTVEGDVIEVRLRNKEVAYLVPVGFYERGRNFIWHTVLVRPSLKEVREVEEPVRRDLEVYDLNHDGISEIITVSLGSGQGSTIGEKSIVQFEEWAPIVLHKAGFEDNEGAYGKRDYRFFSRSVSWQFIDLDNDGILDLVEEITIEKGRNNRSKIKNKFTFKDNAFTRYIDHKRLLKRVKVHG